MLLLALRILFFRNYLFGLGFKSVQGDFQHDFAQMTEEGDNSVVPADLWMAFVRSVILRDCVYRVGHSPVLQILLQISVKTSICPPV